MAVEPSTLLVLPCLYSLLVRDKSRPRIRGVQMEVGVRDVGGELEYDVNEDDNEGPGLAD
jgi:hypothetical protein